MNSESSRLINNTERAVAVSATATLACFSVALVLFFVGMGFASIVIGILAYTTPWDCPLIPELKWWLITFGILSLCSSPSAKIDFSERPLASCISTLMGVAWMVFLILGSVWIFGADENPRDNDFATCNQTLWTTAFAYLISIYSLMAISLFCACCLCLCSACFN